MPRSSTFGSDVPARWPKVGKAPLLATFLYVGFRLLLAVVGEDLAKADWMVREVFAVERMIASEAAVRPSILAMGSSRTRRGISTQVLAREFGRPESDAMSLALNSGGAWEALTFFRRHPRLLHRTDLMLVDVAPWKFTAREVGFRRRRIHLMASLRDRTSTAQDRLRSTLDWFWPFVSQRRTVVDWYQAIRGDPWRTRSDPKPLPTPPMRSPGRNPSGYAMYRARRPRERLATWKRSAPRSVCEISVRRAMPNPRR